MLATRVSLHCAAAALFLACGSNPRADSSAATSDPDAPADAGPVPLGRTPQPPEGGEAGPPALPPTVVKSSTLEAQRLSGSPTIDPNDVEKAVIERGRQSVAVVAKLCVDAAGHVASVKLLRGSGYVAYDRKVMDQVKTWTFRPIVVEGQAVEVCTVKTFAYKSSAAPASAPAP